MFSSNLWHDFFFFHCEFLFFQKVCDYFLCDGSSRACVLCLPALIQVCDLFFWTVTSFFFFFSYACGHEVACGFLTAPFAYINYALRRRHFFLFASSTGSPWSLPFFLFVRVCEWNFLMRITMSAYAVRFVVHLFMKFSNCEVWFILIILHPIFLSTLSVIITFPTFWCSRCSSM